MSAAGIRPALAAVQWRRVAWALAGVLAVLALAPLPLAYSPWPLAAVAGVAAFLVRRRPLDAVLFVGLHLAFSRLEHLTGTQALAFASLAILALTLRPRFALGVGAGLVLALVAAIDTKLRLAGSVLTWQDVHYFFLQFGDNVGVLGSQPTLLLYTAAIVVAFLLVAYILWRTDGPGSGMAKPVGWRWRLAGWLVALAGASISLYLLDRTAYGQVERSVSHLERSSKNTPISTFLSTRYLYAKADFQPVDTTDFRSESERVQAAAGAGTQRPDILLILQESQFNPSAIAGCPRELCALPPFTPTAATTDFGPMRVHTTGGGTWLSEFSVATGLPHTLFGSSGSFAPFNVAPSVSRSFMRSLKALGYRTAAVYPVGGGMMGARSAYGFYGFDRFYEPPDLGFAADWRTTDRAIHAAALRAMKAEQAHGKPVFLMLVTIFNHSEHGVHMERVPPELVRSVESLPSEEEGDARNLADYLWRTREFGKALETTRRELLGGARRPSVLAWFGDHQPPFASAPGLIKRIGGQYAPMPARYVTWYGVETNLQPLRGASDRPQAKSLDIAFLPGLLAQRAGLPLDDWLAANVVGRERCGGLLDECADEGWRNAYFSFLLRDLKSLMQEPAG